MSEKEENIAPHRTPDLRLAQKLYALEGNFGNKDELTKEIMQGINDNDMAFWYKFICQEKNLLKFDSALSQKLEDKVTAKLKEFDDKISIAEKEEGETDVRNLMIQKGEYLAKSGDRIRAIKLFKEIRKGSHVTSNCKLDMAFTQLRLSLFYNDNFEEELSEDDKIELERQNSNLKMPNKEKNSKDEKKEDEKAEKKEDKSKKELKSETKLTDKQIKEKVQVINYHNFGENIQQTKKLVEEGGDWDRRNRLKVYEAIYLVHIREFEKAAKLFLDAVPTFTSYELMSYGDLVSYTTVTAMLSLNRKSLKTDLIDGSDIQEQLYGLPIIKNYLNNFYNCQYDKFFINLAEIEQMLKADRHFSQHTQFYIREMRLAGYKQLLASYSSLAITYMADSFGVTPEYIDAELSKFIASGRIPAKIDHVNGIVVTNRPDLKNQQYRKVVKKGDNLLNRIQKLSRVINI